MKKIIDFFKSHQYIIIIILLVLLVLKSCSGCKAKSDYQFKEYNYTQQIDSLKSNISINEECYKSYINDLIRQNDSLRHELQNTYKIIDVYEGDKQALQQTTNRLISTIQNNSKQHETN
jgi:hypothetical protein